MPISRQISDALESKRKEAQKKIDAKFHESNLNVLEGLKEEKKIRKTFKLRIVLGIASGIVFCTLLKIFFEEEILAIDRGGRELFTVLSFVVGILLMAISFPLRWHAILWEQDKAKLSKLAGITNGVVTSMQRIQAGAVSTGGGWTYTPVFTVEFEVNGKSYSTEWELGFSTNVESSLNKAEIKHMGQIIPVKYNKSNPSEAMLHRLGEKSLSKRLCFAFSYWGYFGIAFSLTIVYFAFKAIE